jgi:hypothetical protein
LLPTVVFCLAEGNGSYDLLFPATEFLPLVVFLVDFFSFEATPLAAVNASTLMRPS